MKKYKSVSEIKYCDQCTRFNNCTTAIGIRRMLKAEKKLDKKMLFKMGAMCCRSFIHNKLMYLELDNSLKAESFYKYSEIKF